MRNALTVGFFFQPLVRFLCHCTWKRLAETSLMPLIGQQASMEVVDPVSIFPCCCYFIRSASIKFSFTFHYTSGEGWVCQYCRTNPNRLAISLLISTSLQRCHLLADTPPFNYLHSQRAFEVALSSVVFPPSVPFLFPALNLALRI